jgi:hypothetical protein
MSDRNLRSRSKSVDSRENNIHSVDMSDDSTCYSREVECSVRENQISGLAELNVNFENIASGNATNNVVSNVQESNIAAIQLQDFLATVMQAIQAESAKQTAFLETRLAAASERQSVESAKIASAIEHLTAKFETAHDNIRDELNVKLNSEIQIVSERLENVRKDHESEISNLSDVTDKRCESVLDGINVHISQTRKQLDVQGQEVVNASRALQASINELKEQTEVTINNSSQEVTQSREYINDKIGILSGDIQNVRKQNADEISKIKVTLGDIQNRLSAVNSDTPQSAFSGNNIAKVTTSDQQAGTVSSAVANTLTNVNSENAGSTSACNDSNSVVSQLGKSCSAVNVNAISELQDRSVGLNELTLPSYTDSTKQVPLHFIRDLDLYFKLKQTPDHLKLPLTFRAVQEPVAKQWFSSTYDKLNSYEEFKKGFTELLWNPNRQAGIRSQIYLDKHFANSGESYVDHYIHYANLASSLDPPLTDMDLLSALTSHFEPKVQQGLLCGNFKSTQEVLGYLSKLQGLTESRDNFRAPRRDCNNTDMNRRPPHNSARDERTREQRNNVNVRYIRRQTDRRTSQYNSRRQDNPEGREVYGRRQGRDIDNRPEQLNPSAPQFNPQGHAVPVNVDRNDRDSHTYAQNLNN